MARSIWNGTIVFGLVAVPIKVHSATESRTVHFREVHAKDGSKIEHRRICPKHRGQYEVDYDDIVKGYEASKGKWVELTDDEVAAAAGSQSRRIEIDHFVPIDDVDPVYYERPYYLGARTRAVTRTRSCTPRSTAPAAPASAAGSSTTASGPCCCARSRTCW